MRQEPKKKNGKTKQTFDIEEVETKPVKHNYKLSLNDKKEIYLDYILNRNKHNAITLCNKYNITETSLYSIIKNEDIKKEVDKEVTKIQGNFTKKASILIDKALDRINHELEDNQSINISQLSTTLGILYDKKQLEQGLSTNNNAININLKIEK